MRISDWSSDVCSSDLLLPQGKFQQFLLSGNDRRAAGGHSPAVPIRRPGGGRRRRLSLGGGLLGLLTACWVRASVRPLYPARAGRSEEHTSELQSLMRISYAVFCLKKKKQNHHHI